MQFPFVATDDSCFLTTIYTTHAKCIKFVTTVRRLPNWRKIGTFMDGKVDEVFILISTLYFFILVKEFLARLQAIIKLTFTIQTENTKTCNELRGESWGEKYSELLNILCIMSKALFWMK